MIPIFVTGLPSRSVMTEPAGRARSPTPTGLLGHPRPDDELAIIPDGRQTTWTYDIYGHTTGVTPLAGTANAAMTSYIDAAGGMAEEDGSRTHQGPSDGPTRI
jgi:hypothetical protein